MSVKLIRKADLSIPGNEAVGAPSAIRAIRIATITHIPLTDHIRVGDATSIVEVQVSPGVAILHPRLSRVQVVTIVVAKDISLIDSPVRTIEVILDPIVITGEVPLSKLIHIAGILSTHQVLDRLILSCPTEAIPYPTGHLKGRCDLLT